MLLGFMVGICTGGFAALVEGVLLAPFGWQDSEGFHAGVPGHAPTGA